MKAFNSWFLEWEWPVKEKNTDTCGTLRLQHRHRFKSLFDEEENWYLGTFIVWPVDKQVLDLETSSGAYSSNGIGCTRRDKPTQTPIPHMGAATQDGMRSKLS